MKTYYLHSLGCKVNSYETEAIGVELSRLGYQRTKDAISADIIVLNTCSVTSRADGKSRQKISSFRKGNPSATLVVMGCFSQTHAEQAHSLGGNIVLGASKRSKIIEYIKQYEETHQDIVDVAKSLRRETYEELGANAYCENARAYLKIQDGCDNFCSYCFIPTLRGNSRSREPREVIEEAMSLSISGYKEIVITGIHIGAYGKDLGDGSYRLADLLESILSKCPELYRLRISSIEESEIDERFLSLLRRHPRIANHLHIPLQSGSEKVLKDMKRHYDSKGFLDKLSAIRAIRPDIAITTDVIVGYPTETEDDFIKTLEFCKKANFSTIHVFPFSSRPGTFAATLEDLAPKIKKDRVAKLLSLSKSLCEDYQRQFVGKEMEILVEEKDAKKGCYKGHTSNYLEGEVFDDSLQHGDIVSITYKMQ